MANKTNVTTSRKSQTGKNPGETSTQLAVSSTGNSLIPTTKAEVPAAIAALEAKLKELKGDIKNEISTDIMYDSQNIKNITTVKELLAISASIRARSAAYQKEIENYNLQGKVEEFSETEKSAVEWYAIIQKAIFELINNSQIKIIESSITKLSKYLDEDTRLANELASIMTEASAKLK